MNMTYEHGFAVFGVMVVAIITCTAIAVAIFGVLVLAFRYCPRFHLGAPKLPCEWVTYADTATGTPQVVQRLRLRWWVALSNRNSAGWVFGLLRYTQAAE